MKYIYLSLVAILGFTVISCKSTSKANCEAKCEKKLTENDSVAEKILSEYEKTSYALAFTLANDMKLKIKIKKVGKEELRLADEIFLSGTAAEITPVIKIDKRKIGDGKVGNITKLLMDTYSNIVMNKNKNYSNWLTVVY